jgi:MFS family permease
VSRRGPLAAFFAFGFFWGGWAALVPAVQDAVGASKGELGLALLFVAIGSLPSMLVTGRELDRHGARLIPVLLAGLGVAAVLPAFANTLPVLAASLFAIGVLGGGLDVAINAAVSELEVRRGARLMQLAHALFSAGLLAGAIASGISRQLGANRLEVLGGIAVVLVAAAALNLGHARVERKAATSRRGLSLSRAAIPLGIACAAAFVIEGGMENWGALFLERELNADPAVSALAPGAYACAMMLGRLSGQWLEHLLGDTLLLMGAFGVAFVGLVTVALAENVPLAVVAFFIGGAGISIAAPALFGGGGRNAAPEERGRAVATVTTIGYLGFLVGPPFVGGAAEAVGLRAAFAALALVAVALVIATPRLGLGRKSR